MSNLNLRLIVTGITILACLVLAVTYHWAFGFAVIATLYIDDVLSKS